MTKIVSNPYQIPADHPCLAGHFPGDPIVPGVVLLDYVSTFIKQHCPETTIGTISQAKFHQPLRPDEKFVIQLEKTNPCGFKFECLKDTDKLASGKLTIHQLHD